VNWSSIFCMFGRTLTRPSLTMQLTSGVDVFAHECRQKADTSSNYLWQYSLFSHMTRDVSVFVKYDTIFSLFFFRKLPQFHTSNFRKVVRQHIEGMVGSVIWVLLEIYLAFQQWKYFKNPLRIDKVIAMSLLYYFFGHSVGYITPHCTRYMRMSISDDENTPVIHCWLNSAGLPMRRHMVYTYYYYSRFFYPPFTR